jgi:hypothetical protein
MRRVIVSVAISALIVGLSACANPGPRPQAGEADGVTGATIKRAAVLGDHVDFGGDVNSVENYDLQTQGASVGNPVDASDLARDNEIDSIVNKISNDHSASSTAQPQSNDAKSAPAVPSLSRRSELLRQGAAAGVTGSVEPKGAASALPPLPDSVSNPTAGEDAQMAADQARLFPKPLWRRELEKKSQAAPSNAPASTN